MPTPIMFPKLNTRDVRSGLESLANRLVNEPDLMAQCILCFQDEDGSVDYLVMGDGLNYAQAIAMLEIIKARVMQKLITDHGED